VLKRPTAGSRSSRPSRTATGTRVGDWFPCYPSRLPRLGNLSTDESTVAREVAVADRALDFWDVIYYDGGSDWRSRTLSAS
jgi:hypothetical protein